MVRGHRSPSSLMIIRAWTEAGSDKPLRVHIRTMKDLALPSATNVNFAEVGEVSFEVDELEGPLRRLAEERGWKVGDLFMAIRVAITGRTATPPLFDTLVALGQDRVLARLDTAIDRLERTTAEEDR